MDSAKQKVFFLKTAEASKMMMDCGDSSFSSSSSSRGFSWHVENTTPGFDLTNLTAVLDVLNACANATNEELADADVDATDWLLQLGLSVFSHCNDDSDSSNAAQSMEAFSEFALRFWRVGPTRDIKLKLLQYLSEHIISMNAFKSRGATWLMVAGEEENDGDSNSAAAYNSILLECLRGIDTIRERDANRSSGRTDKAEEDQKHVYARASRMWLERVSQPLADVIVLEARPDQSHFLNVLCAIQSFYTKSIGAALDGNQLSPIPLEACCDACSNVHRIVAQGLLDVLPYYYHISLPLAKERSVAACDLLTKFPVTSWGEAVSDGILVFLSSNVGLEAIRKARASSSSSSWLKMVTRALLPLNRILLFSEVVQCVDTLVAACGEEGVLVNVDLCAAMMQRSSFTPETLHDGLEWISLQLQRNNTLGLPAVAKHLVEVAVLASDNDNKTDYKEEEWVGMPWRLWRLAIRFSASFSQTADIMFEIIYPGLRETLLQTDEDLVILELLPDFLTGLQCALEHLCDQDSKKKETNTSESLMAVLSACHETLIEIATGLSSRLKRDMQRVNAIKAEQPRVSDETEYRNCFQRIPHVMKLQKHVQQVANQLNTYGNPQIV